MQNLSSTKWLTLAVYREVFFFLDFFALYKQYELHYDSHTIHGTKFYIAKSQDLWKHTHTLTQIDYYYQYTCPEIMSSACP